MAQVTWNIFRLLWFWTPGFTRGLLKVWAYSPAPHFWRARAQGMWHNLLHRVASATLLSPLIRLQKKAFKVTGLPFSLALSGRPSLYLLFQRIIR